MEKEIAAAQPQQLLQLRRDAVNHPQLRGLIRDSEIAVILDNLVYTVGARLAAQGIGIIDVIDITRFADGRKEPSKEQEMRIRFLYDMSIAFARNRDESYKFMAFLRSRIPELGGITPLQAIAGSDDMDSVGVKVYSAAQEALGKSAARTQSLMLIGENDGR